MLIQRLTCYTMMANWLHSWGINYAGELGERWVRELLILYDISCWSKVAENAFPWKKIARGPIQLRTPPEKTWYTILQEFSYQSPTNPSCFFRFYKVSQKFPNHLLSLFMNSEMNKNMIWFFLVLDHPVEWKRNCWEKATAQGRWDVSWLWY